VVWLLVLWVGSDCHYRRGSFELTRRLLSYMRLSELPRLKKKSFDRGHVNCVQIFCAPCHKKCTFSILHANASCCDEALE